MPENDLELMNRIINLSARRGFIFPSSQIYGGLSSTYDYGPLGVELKNNIKKAWWKMFVTSRPDMYGMDASIIMHPKVWEASGHIENFSDPLVDCVSCKNRFRYDHLLEKNSLQPGYDKEKPMDLSKISCPNCGGKLTEPRNFNLMFKTFMGAVEEDAATVYLRPETAGGMFVNFKNVVETMRARVPFGLGQIGKAFRNEITTENYIFRMREFEQMEVEYFVHPNEWEKSFDDWLNVMRQWCAFLGIKPEYLHEHEIAEADRAFYSKRTIDFEFQYPFGIKELYGLAYRTDYDLSQHQKFSTEKLHFDDPITKERYLPHVIEPSLGVDRSFLACLLSAYTEIDGGRSTTTEAIKEVEVVLRFPYELAPVKVAVLPLSKKEPLNTLALDLVKKLKTKWNCLYDETGSIGKRYRRQDEIGTPFCVTVDFETVEDNKVTIRDRDTMEQIRLPLSEVESWLSAKFNF